MGVPVRDYKKKKYFNGNTCKCVLKGKTRSFCDFEFFLCPKQQNEKRNLIKFQKTLDKLKIMVYDIYVNFKKGHVINGTNQVGGYNPR